MLNPPLVLLPPPPVEQAMQFSVLRPISPQVAAAGQQGRARLDDCLEQFENLLRLANAIRAQHHPPAPVTQWLQALNRFAAECQQVLYQLLRRLSETQSVQSLLAKGYARGDMLTIIYAIFRILQNRNYPTPSQQRRQMRMGRAPVSSHLYKLEKQLQALQREGMTQAKFKKAISAFLDALHIQQQHAHPLIGQQRGDGQPAAARTGPVHVVPMQTRRQRRQGRQQQQQLSTGSSSSSSGSGTDTSTSSGQQQQVYDSI